MRDFSFLVVSHFEILFHIHSAADIDFYYSGWPSFFTSVQMVFVRCWDGSLFQLFCIYFWVLGIARVSLTTHYWLSSYLSIWFLPSHYLLFKVHYIYYFCGLFSTAFPGSVGKEDNQEKLPLTLATRNQSNLQLHIYIHIWLRRCQLLLHT